MAFFARPNLDNTQFKQLQGSELTLSGQTQIATISGLTLTDGSGGYVPIQATGGTNSDVLTYRDGIIHLESFSGGSGAGTYPYNESATTTVGGLVTGQNLYNELVVDILHDILVPTLSPTITQFSNTLSTIPTTTYYEVGYSLSITGTSTFNRGCVNPQYCGGSPYVAGLPKVHEFQPFFNGNVSACTTLLTTGSTFIQTINSGSNSLCSRVWYSSGDTPIYDSSGSILYSAATSGVTSWQQKKLCGIYPWYWGRVTCAAPAGVGRPTAASIKNIITGGTACCKCVGVSNGTICVNFGSSSSDYIWFAIPSASTVKTKWYIDALNNGTIGGAVSAGGNLFPSQESITGVTSSSPVWSGQTYQTYVSNYQSAAMSIMELRNS